MGPHHTNEQPTSDLQTVITGRFNNFACELTAMIESIQFGRLQFTGDEYKAMETASRDLAKIANNIADEVKALGKRRKAAVVAEGQKLLSQAESAKLGMMASQKPKSLVLFVRNMQLFFNPPGESKLDSPTVQKRKQLTRERCERLRGLAPDKIILWAAAFAPSIWDSNVLQKSTFDFVVEFLEPGNSLSWPPHIYGILNTLVTEQPLCQSSGFKEFLTAVQESVETGQKVTGSCSQKAQTQQTEVPDVDEGAQEVIERAFLVPPTKLDKLLKLHPQSTARHSIILTIPIVDRVATVLISIPREDAIRFGWESSLPVIFNASPQPTFVQSTSARLTLPQFDD
ncbi:uncharacterized protein PGRI_000100 [Penicillium griseofulvum]|uniref:Uncharacterized protein n=1 Tax=Penicillium patulum TaxID=5078 RepID=A0A135LVG8_PENPA|nr:uncharacterized protein PGRI_000100 [Penicillium griseofulvum]KXG52960.1 hypothetical protein PGRI_000100 [Penicillium griseofulvum]